LHPLKVHGKGIEGLEAVAVKEAYAVHTVHITSQWQYDAPRHINSCVDNVFDLSSCNIRETRRHTRATADSVTREVEAGQSGVAKFVQDTARHAVALAERPGGPGGEIHVAMC
jgi:hypothetical protein